MFDCFRMIDWFFLHHILLVEALTCSGREDGLSSRHGVKPLTHSLIQSLEKVTIGVLGEGFIDPSYHSLTEFI